MKYHRYYRNLNTGVIPTILICDKGKYCLFPRINNLTVAQRHARIEKNVEIPVREPAANGTAWTVEDFESILPLSDDTREFFYESALHQFLISGCYCKHRQCTTLYA
jgi:hypothetical protein